MAEKNPIRMKSKNKYPRQKKIAIKKIMTKLERLKNHGGWNWKSFGIWYIIYKLKMVGVK